ncbi:MAG: choice-of-anchor D domain-containing protein, partial [Candidatus Sulfotelmatobacter sp.]
LAVNVTFTPTAKGEVGGSIILYSNASNRVLYLGVAGDGATSQAVTVSPRNLSFGNVEMGASSKLTTVLTNTSPKKVTVTGLQTVGTGFSVSGATFPLTLPAGTELKLDVTFEPQAVGPVGGSSLVFGPNLDITFTGTGIGVSKPELAITPATLNFGDVAVGTTEKRTVELSATGGNVTVSSVSSSSSQFAVLDAPLPLTVSVGKEVSLNVAFTPQTSGNPSATLSFASDAVDSPAHSALIGTGTSAFVSLSWIASTSPEVTGYNIYRKASVAGSYARINSKLDPDTNYTDATVIHGTTYYYATTAVNAKGKESDYSNRVEVVVP